jgi:hypothetical protein
MFGIFEGIRSIAVILGFVFTIYIFKYYDGYTFFLFIIPLSLLSMALLFFIPTPAKTNNYQRIDSNSKVGLEKIINYFQLLSIK